MIYNESNLVKSALLATGGSLITADINEAHRRYILSRAPFVLKNFFITEDYWAIFDLPGRNAFLLEREFRTNAATVMLQGSISGDTWITISPTTLTAAIVGDNPVQSFSSNFPWRYFRLKADTGSWSGTGLTLSLAGDGTTLSTLTTSIVTAGSAWAVGDEIAVGDAYENGGIIRVTSIATSPYGVATYDIIRPGDGYYAQASIGTTAALPCTFSAVRM
jgi:hypothetical protein